MTYYIPVNKFEKLEKIITRYQKKGANIIFNTGKKEVVKSGTLTVCNGFTRKVSVTPIDVKCYEVEVDGVYRINGWQFVGTIDFTENGNIIRLADSSFTGKIPLKYLHTPKICEHCGKIRNRKDTYLIYNDDTGEFKQVGSSCLLDFTHGLDANACADIMSCLNKVIAFGDLNCTDDEFFGNGYDSTGYGLCGDIVRKHAISLVNAFGYSKMYQGEGTARDLVNWILNNDEQGKFDKLTPAGDEMLEEINEYAKAHLDDEFGYMRNASLSWLKDSVEYRDFGLICSFVYTYNKEMKKEEEKKARLSELNNEWVGNIGDRITIKVASTRLLYSNTMEIAWHTYANVYAYEIKDNEGHIYIWKSSKTIDQVEKMGEPDSWGDCKVEFVNVKPLEIVATIKEHSTYGDVKQTIITRGKVTKAE